MKGRVHFLMVQDGRLIQVRSLYKTFNLPSPERLSSQPAILVLLPLSLWDSDFAHKQTCKDGSRRLMSVEISVVGNQHFGTYFSHTQNVQVDFPICLLKATGYSPVGLSILSFFFFFFIKKSQKIPGSSHFRAHTFRNFFPKMQRNIGSMGEWGWEMRKRTAEEWRNKVQRKAHIGLQEKKENRR